MKKVNALELRKSLGRVVAELEATGEPILLEKGRRPVGVIISVHDFEQRFMAKDAADARRRAVDGIRVLARPAVDATEGVDVLRSLRQTGA